MNPWTGEHPEPAEHLLELEDALADADTDQQWMTTKETDQ